MLLRWVWPAGTDHNVAPAVIFRMLRSLMFGLSFVLEDWAIHELVQSPRQRRVALLLVASSYVTWTFQTHTFSNSVETILVAWSLVLVQRIVDNKVDTGLGFSVLSESNLSWLGAFFKFYISLVGISCRLRHLQPDHIPSLFAFAMSAVTATFSCKVGDRIPPR